MAQKSEPAIAWLPQAPPTVVVFMTALVVMVASVFVPALPAVAAEESVPVMVVLDASGSMLEEDAPGSRIEAAKAAVLDLIDAVEPGSEMGLMVYGTGTDSSPEAAEEGCRDIRMLAPVGPLDKEGLSAEVTAIEASGYTPVGNSLVAASEALQSVEGPRSIVLVSDGIDTCAPPAPCDVARDLAATGVDLTIHSIGFKVDGAARAELECIAAVTGGSYSEADDADALR